MPPLTGKRFKTTDWIQTFTGKKFFPLTPDPELICIEDIAHSLSMQCRYNGHSKQFYSVAQHRVILSQKFFSSRDMQLAALLHDASEAYLSDIPRPLKNLPQFAFYRQVEDRLSQLIYSRFGVKIDRDEQALIKAYDNEMIYHEVSSENIMSPVHTDWQMPPNSLRKFYIDPWNPQGAEVIFLSTFKWLTRADAESVKEVA